MFKSVRVLLIAVLLSLAACQPAASRTPTQPAAASAPALQRTEPAAPPSPTPFPTDTPLPSEPPASPTPTHLPTSTTVPTPVPGTLFADPAVDLGPISPLVYGSNYGPWVALRFEMIPKAVEARITSLRYPGGAWGDNNNLQPFQIDQLIALCQQLGAEPSISVRLKNGTPEAAAELVRYANLEKDYNVRYWSIGNEPTFYSKELKEDYDTVRFNQEWRRIAEAMKAVDPGILLIGPELHQFTSNPNDNPKDSAGRDWMTEFLKANGDLVDIVSIHRYPFPRDRNNPYPQIDELRRNPAEWDAIIPYLRGLIQETTGRDLPIAVTEINSNYTHKISGGDATPDSFYNAIWWADVLGRMIRQGVTLVNHWLLTSRLDQGGWGLIGPSELRPTYYVYLMYKQFGNQLVYSSSDDPDVSIYAAQRGDGSLSLLVVNLADEEKSKPLAVNGINLGQAEYWLFDAGHPAENLGAVDLSSGTITLPPQSISAWILPNP